MFLARLFGGLLLGLSLSVFLSQFDKLGLDSGDPLPAAIFRISRRSLEALEFAAKLIPLEPELVRLTTQPIAFAFHESIALYHRRTDLLDFLLSTFVVHAQTVLRRANRFQLLFPALDQLGKPADLDPSEFCFVFHDASFLLQSRDLDTGELLLPLEPFDFCSQCGSFLYQAFNICRSHPAESCADCFQLVHRGVELVKSPVMLGPDLVESHLELLILDVGPIVLGCNTFAFGAKLLDFVR